MKISIWYGKNDFKVIEKELPKLGPKEVLAKIVYTSVCGSDLHVVDGWFGDPPRALGHEFSGTVAAIGSEVVNCKVGDKIIAHTKRTCGECEFCQSGNQQLCLHTKINTDFGAFAEYIILDSHRTFVLPDKLDLLTAVLAEPLSIAVHTFELSVFKPGDLVVVIGGGPIGLLCAKYAEYLGARLVILSEPSMDRQKVAKEMKVGIVTDPDNLEQIAMEETKGLGVDICVDAVVLESTAKAGLKILRPGGQLLITGIASKELALNVNLTDLFRREINITGVNWSNNHSIIMAAKMLLSLGDKLKPMITIYDGLESLPQIIKDLKDKKVQKGVIKV